MYTHDSSKKTKKTLEIQLFQNLQCIYSGRTNNFFTF